MKNLILITSVVNTPNLPLSYSKTRSVFTRQERFAQTKKTIESIKEKIPDYKIMLVECTSFTEEEESYFEKECDYILNLWERQELHDKIFGKSKALGEGTMTIEALNYIQYKKLEYENLFKISGRYWLGKNFNYNNFDNNELVFKHNKDGVVTTTLYKIPKVLVKKILYTLYKILFIENRVNIMYEHIFSTFLKSYEVHFIDTIGIYGFCTTRGNKFEF